MNRRIFNARALAAAGGALLGVSAAAGNALQPLGKIPGKWEYAAEFSDEFNASAVDAGKWDSNPRSWGTWSWDAKNAVQQDGQLRLRMMYEPHTRNGQKLFYKSGIIRSRKPLTYGYYEARIKGCSLFPGACPSFWTFSDSAKSGKFRYSEVDFVEMQQNRNNQGVKRMDCDLHCRIENEKGEEVWIRPLQDPALCAHVWQAPWDPRADFHVYGGEVTPEKITWYIDGQMVATAENRYWHLPMFVTLSLGLRAPYERYVKGDRVVVAEKSTGNGFPTEMTVDYVRVWKPA
jgi:beta-glucanase (GH16 family)